MSKPQRLPIATLALIAISLVAASFTLTDPDSLLRWGYIPQPLGSPTTVQRIATAVTSLIVHLDPLHLLGNMLVLAAVGPAVERAVGMWKLLLVFLVSGLIGVAAHHVAATTATPAIAGEPLAGSSAAIAGLIGYAWLRFHRAKVPLLPNLWAPVWVVILVWVVLQAGGAWFSSIQFGAPVAYFAHLFGFVAGFALGLIFGAAATATNEAWEEHLREAAKHGHSTKAAVLRGRSDAGSQAQLAMTLLQSGELDQAAAIYAKLAQESGRVEDAVTRLASMGKLGLIPRADRMRMASNSESDTAGLLLDSLLHEPDDSLTPAALEAAVDLQARVNPNVAKSAVRRLLNEYALSPEAERIRTKYPELT